MLSATKPSSSKISSLRFVRAYAVTFKILAKYFVLFLIKRIISEQRASAVSTWAHRRTTNQIVDNILKLKGLYIKVGQALSIMTNFLPESLTSGLEKLQDAVPPHHYKDVEIRFLEDFGKTPPQMFASFDKKPIASASLAQVHIARLGDGSKLAVKLQYPDIDEIVRHDLRTIKRIFGILDFVFPNYGLEKVYEECAKIILQELDFEAEGKNLERIRNNFTGQPQYIFPKIYWDHSSKKILTAEFIEGIKVTNIDALKKAGIDPHEVAVSLIHMYCKQIFIDGVYHADPHPGNIIIVPGGASGGVILSDHRERPPLKHGGSAFGGKNPVESSGSFAGAQDDMQESPIVDSRPSTVSHKIAMVDYGATATVSPQMKGGITLFVEGLIKKDTRLISSSMRQMGFVAKEEGEESIEKIVDYFYGKIKGIKIDNFKDIKISQFQNLDDILELKKMDISFRELSSTFYIPKDWVLLERAMLLMMGLVTHLDPSLNPADIVLPYVEQFVLGKNKKMGDIILQATKEVLLSYINLPAEIHKVLRKLQEGKIVIRHKNAKEHSERIYRGFRQLIYTLLMIASGSTSYIFYKEGNLEWMTNMKYAAGVFGGLLVLSFVRGKGK